MKVKEKEKFCVDCKYCLSKDRYEHNENRMVTEYWCTYKETKKDMVTGVLIDIKQCYIHRNNLRGGNNNGCGKEAKYHNDGLAF